jgi:hypothetical protein
MEKKNPREVRVRPPLFFLAKVSDLAKINLKMDFKK